MTKEETRPYSNRDMVEYLSLTAEDLKNMTSAKLVEILRIQIGILLKALEALRILSQIPLLGGSSTRHSGNKIVEPITYLVLEELAERS